MWPAPHWSPSGSSAFSGSAERPDKGALAPGPPSFHNTRYADAAALRWARCALPTLQPEHQMLKFYFNGVPNPNKVALFLEESGLPFEAIPVDTRKGEQFAPDFLKVNPNGKVPAIDDDGVFVFDSNAILLYLAEKTGKFLPPGTPANRAQMLSWLMFIATGVGPYSGQGGLLKK